MRIGSLFSGYGGLDMGVQQALGGMVAWHSDNDPGAARILAHHWPDVPNLGDVTNVEWAQVEPVDVLTGGFPCQDVSHAGKRLGLRPNTRTGLWSHIAHAVDQLRPSLVVAENVRGLLSAAATSDLEPCPWCVGDDVRGALRALGAVLGDMADLGYDARWTGIRAADVGAPHGRFRVFVTAYPRCIERVAVHGVSSDRGSSSQPAGSPSPPPDADSAGGEARSGRPWTGHAGRRESVVGSGAAATDAKGHEQRQSDVGRLAPKPGDGITASWGQYAPAVTRWEHILGRPAPAPTEPGRTGQPRLSPAFVEWMMGLPAGHVTDVPGLGRTWQLKALGNGVVPAQAEAALRMMLGGEAVGVGGPGVLLPTPRATDGTKGGPNQRGSSGDLMLPSAVQTFGGAA